jgi:hypothetical protein
MAVRERYALDQVTQVCLLARWRAWAATAVRASPGHAGQATQLLDVGVVLEKALRLGGSHCFDEVATKGAL